MGNQDSGRGLFFSLHIAATQTSQLVCRVDEAAGYCKHSCSKSQFLFIISTTPGISSSLPRPCHSKFIFSVIHNCQPYRHKLLEISEIIQKHTHHQSQTLGKFCICERPSRSNLQNQAVVCYRPSYYLVNTILNHSRVILPRLHGIFRYRNGIEEKKNSTNTQTLLVYDMMKNSLLKPKWHKKNDASPTLVITSITQVQWNYLNGSKQEPLTIFQHALSTCSSA